MEPNGQPSATCDLIRPASDEEVACQAIESDEQGTFKEQFQSPAAVQGPAITPPTQLTTSSSAEPQADNLQTPVEVSDTKTSGLKLPEQLSESSNVSRDSATGGTYYNPPSWALPCPEKDQYFIEVIKNGTTLPDDMVVLSGVDHCIFGRQPRGSLNPKAKTGKCSVMLHPSISRVHAFLQYGTGPNDQPPGWFIYDLQSTHGTFVNKHRAPPRRYIRLHVGYVLRFGSSTRLLVLHGPEHDVEPESKESWSELVAAHAKRKAEQEAKLRSLEDEEREGKRQRQTSDETTSVGGECDWGIADDANDEVGGDNFLQRLADGASCLQHEKSYIDDPKKALKSYFDREGIDPPPEYDFVEGRFGQLMCRLELPLDSGTVYAEVPVTGRKRKEAIVACALEACHLLDRLGEFDANKEGAEALRRAREREYWQANDYYSSDEDNFLDRTGQVEARRRRRMRKMGVEVADTEEDKAAKTPSEEAQDSLTMLSNLEKIGKAIIEVEEELHAAERAMEATGENASEMDELEAYMDAIKKGAPNRAARQALKRRLFALRQDETRLLCKLGIRRGTGRFCSSSSSAAANAIRSALANRDNSTDGTVAVVGVEHTRSETKLNSIKRQLPKPIHRSHPSAIDDVENEVFVPEVDDEDDHDEGGKCRPNGSTGQTGESESLNTEPHKVETSETNSPAQCRTDDTGNLSLARIPTAVPPEGANEAFKSPMSLETSAMESETSQHFSTHTSPPTDPSTSPPPKSSHCSSWDIPKEPDDYNTNDPNYSLWVPPKDQTGDGMTELNKKYGY